MASKTPPKVGVRFRQSIFHELRILYAAFRKPLVIQLGNSDLGELTYREHVTEKEEQQINALNGGADKWTDYVGQMCIRIPYLDSHFHIDSKFSKPRPRPKPIYGWCQISEKNNIKFAPIIDKYVALRQEHKTLLEGLEKVLVLRRNVAAVLYEWPGLVNIDPDCPKIEPKADKLVTMTDELNIILTKIILRRTAL